MKRDPEQEPRASKRYMPAACKQATGSFAMWAVACILALVYIGSTLPTPLYVLYRQRFHFSEITLTLIYAVYVAGTLSALIFFGRLSDQVGRRKAVLPALAIIAVSTVLFITAGNTATLFPARLLSGFAVGIIAGTATAWIVELHPRRLHASATAVAVVFILAGLALGPLMSGLLAQYAPLPLRLTYIVYLPLLLLAASIAFRARESIEHPVRVKEVSLRPRVGVPNQIRSSFIAPAATAFATFALFGFFSAVIPSLLVEKLHETNHAIGGTTVFELSLIATLITIFTRAVKSRTAMLSGMLVLLPGIALLELARESRSMAILLGATAVCGVSVAFGYRGSLEVINQISPESQRAEVLSAYFVACYIGLSLPVIGVGMISQLVSPEIANLTFAAVVAFFAIAAVITGVKYATS
ncbi:MAG: MFS transporter [Terriglobia bacterium]